MSEDISKNTLMVLVILTIVISLLGTWTVVNEASQVKSYDASMKPATQQTSAKVSVMVTEPVKPVTTAGRVSIEIV